MLRIGFLGPKGTFSQEALLVYAKDRSDYVACECNTVLDALMGVRNGDLDEAIVPIENSLEGAINATLDVMATESVLKIKAEIIIAVKQNLLVKRNTRIEDIKVILSHPQPIGQCRNYINSRFPNAETRFVYSTARAAEEVANGDGDMAAIGSTIASEVYGLDILEHGIQDGDNNHTRFVIVSKTDSERTGSDKTSIVFSTEDKPGSLYRILDIFSLWDINMTKIESRPAKNQLGRYIFFIDLIGHRDDENVRDALTMVKRKSTFYKLLGSYKQQA